MKPVPLPINNCPLAAVDALTPVPPRATSSCASDDRTPDALFTTTPLALNADSVTAPFADRAVKAPVDGVAKPIAVPLIPVAVVLRLLEVIIILFPPASIDAAVNPERASVPDDAVRLRAPPVSVKPLEAVSKPADVIVPVPVVKILPEVLRLPFSEIVRVADPLD